MMPGFMPTQAFQGGASVTANGAFVTKYSMNLHVCFYPRLCHTRVVAQLTLEGTCVMFVLK